MMTLTAPVGWGRARSSIFAGVVGLVLLTSACGGSSPGGAGVSTSVRASSASPTVTDGPSSDAEKPATIAPKPTDPLIGKYVPVWRNGKAAAPTISAPPALFTEKLRYVDGTTLQVTSIKQGKVSGQGPGVFPGQPITTFGLRLTNGAKKAVGLNQVVVTATYGSPQRVAMPVYSTSAHDFAGNAIPGASANATYAFSIPTTDLAPS